MPYVIAGPCIEPGKEGHVVDNERFFTLALPGRDAPLDAPGGAGAVGRVGVDTELVATA